MRQIFLLTLLFVFGLCSAQKKIQYSNAVIVYMSKHGTTGKVAAMIKDSIKNEPVTIINLKKQRNPDVRNCDLIMIGGSFHVGKIQKNVRRFCAKNEELLLTKTVGIFVCGMFTGEEAQKEFNNAFSEKLRKHAKAKSFMGYELYFEKMNPVTRAIMKKNSGATQNVYKIDLKSVHNFISELRK